MKNLKDLYLMCLISFLFRTVAFAQEPEEAKTLTPVNLSGPRVGLTLLSGKLAYRLEEQWNAGPVITQFGWQFEQRLFSLPSGTTGLVEWVVLVGGLDQNLFLPSLTWLVGLRGGAGAEIGVGPNLSVAGAGLAIAAGVTARSGGINFPINIAVVPSTKSGTRVSLLIGFNTRKR